MKAWEKLLTVDKSIGYCREMAVSIYKMNSRCPASIEAKYHLIGDAKLIKFCELGCGVNCVNEYLDLKIKG
jgi:hypothetical protein